MKTSKSEKILRSAKKYVERGWCKNVSEDSNGNVCALGGLGRAGRSYLKTNNYGYCVPYINALNLLKSLAPDGLVAAYNDAKTTRKKDVLSLFDWAIGISQAGGL